MAFWEDGTIGVSAKVDIPAFKVNSIQAFMFIPKHLIISPSSARKSDIGHIFNSNPYWFSGHPKADFEVLLVYLIYEKFKGAGSKWHNYFTAISDLEILSDWDPSELLQLQDPFLVQQSEETLEQIEKIFTELLEIFNEHSDYFPQGQNLKDIFNWSWRLLSTRAFDHEELRVIPMADFINFANSEVCFENMDGDVLSQQASNVESIVDYRDFNGNSNKGHGSMDSTRHKNRLEEYLSMNPNKQYLKEMNAIWEVDRVLRDFESSDDEEEIHIVEIKKIEDDEEDEEEDEDDEAKEEENIGGDDFTVVYTGAKNPIRQGAQVFQQIKKLSNRDWLLQYGFCFENNRFDSSYLLMWSPSFGRTGLVTLQDIQQGLYKADLNGATLADVTELIILKEHKFNTDLLKYLRKTIDFARFNLNEPQMKATPSSVAVELVVIEQALEIYARIEEGKSTFANDLNLMNRTLPKRMKYALIYRMAQKKIITSQKNSLVLARSVLNKVKDGEEIDKHLTEKTIKSIKLMYPLAKYLRSLRGNLKNSAN